MQKDENTAASSSFKVEDITQGISIYRVQKALTKAEAARLMREVEQALSKGKAKLILDLTAEAATCTHGYGYLEKAFRGLRRVARKMQGDILYVLPQKIADRLPGTLSNLNNAVESLVEANSEEDLREESIKLREKVIFQEAQIRKLTIEVNLLTKKTQELASIVGQPNTDKELRAAMEHYRMMASELQVGTPAPKTEKTGP